MLQIESNEMEITPSIRSLIEKKFEAIKKVEPRISSFHAHLWPPKGAKPDEKLLLLQIHIPQNEVIIEEAGENLYHAINVGFQKARQKIIHLHQKRDRQKFTGRKKKKGPTLSGQPLEN